MKKQTWKAAVSAAAIAASAMAANAASSITIDSVQQRWPWNNKVDITYTVTDGQNRAGGIYAGINFAITIPGYSTQVVSGNSLAASAETGGPGSRQYTVTWTAPGGVKATSCSVTATLFPTNVPSGNDYMIIDLASGAIIYERDHLRGTYGDAGRVQHPLQHDGIQVHENGAAQGPEVG